MNERASESMRLDEWLSTLSAQGGSDLYLVAGVPASIRVHGAVRHLPEPTLTGDEIEQAVLPALPRHGGRKLRSTRVRGCLSAALGAWPFPH